MEKKHYLISTLYLLDELIQFCENIKGFKGKEQTDFEKRINGLNKIKSKYENLKEEKELKVINAKNILETQNKKRDYDFNLKTIFSEIYEEKRNEEKDEKYYKRTALNLKNIFPDQVSDSQIDLDAFKSLNEELKILLKRDEKEIEVLHNEIYYILERYTTYFRANDVDKAKSLFQDIKMTSAVINCISQKEEDKLMLIEADVSGIQSFIYKISEGHDTKKNVAKSLRGRSIYVSSLVDFLSLYVINELNLTMANILYCGGGGFQIIANLDEKKLNELEVKIQRYLYDEFKASISVVFAYEEFKLSEISTFKKIVSKVKSEIQNKKHKKYLSIIEKNKKDFFYVKENHGECKYCGNGNVKIKNEENECDICLSLKTLGGWIVDRKKSKLRKGYNYLGYSFVGKESGNLLVEEKETKYLKIGFGELGNIYFSNDSKVLNDKKCIVKEKIYTSGNEGFYSEDEIFKTKFVGNLVAVKKGLEGEVASFSDLVNFATGDKKIGVLKMDIDNLGFVFSTVGDGQLVEVATISNFIDLFFSGYINKICSDLYSKLENENKEKMDEAVYINYAGGDDLLIIAAWDIALDLSRKIKSELDKYVAGNKDITISAGLFICGEKYPIRLSTELAEKLLEKSKEMEGKDAITFFDEAIPWNENHIKIKSKEVKESYNLDEMIKFSSEIEKEINAKRLSRGIIQNITAASERAAQFDDYQLIPIIAYLLKRNEDRRNKRIIGDLRSKIITTNYESSEIKTIKYPNKIALMKTRKRED